MVQAKCKKSSPGPRLSVGAASKLHTMGAACGTGQLGVLFGHTPLSLCLWAFAHLPLRKPHRQKRTRRALVYFPVNLRGEDWEQRKKDRAEETEAVSKAVSVLGSNDARDMSMS